MDVSLRGKSALGNMWLALDQLVRSWVDGEYTMDALEISNGRHVTIRLRRGRKGLKAEFLSKSQSDGDSTVKTGAKKKCSINSGRTTV